MENAAYFRSWIYNGLKTTLFVRDINFNIILNIPKNTVHSLGRYSCPLQLICCSAVRFRITTYTEMEVCSLNILGGSNVFIRIRMFVLRIYVFIMNVNKGRK